MSSTINIQCVPTALLWFGAATPPPPALDMALLTEAEDLIMTEGDDLLIAE